MRQRDLPQRWQERLQNHLTEISSKYNELAYWEFQNDLKVTFQDRSYAFFHYAFYWVNKEWKEVCVFTEHCGYHVFYLIGTKFETLDKSGNIIKTEDYST